MNYPLFLDIEVSSPDEGQFPIAIAWSLPDGQIKSVLICPDDDWEPWDNSEPEVDIQYLLDQGFSGLDVIREMNQDLSGQTVFVDGLDDDEALLELLFETFGSDPDFEIAAIGQLFSQMDLEDILTMRQQTANAYEFDLGKPEENVKTLLYMNQALN